MPALVASESAESTTALGDWFANALFWRPQVALLVNERTLLPVFVALAPAATLLDRVPGAIESVLRLHGASEEFLAAEREAMREVRVAPTNNRSVVGVMNELAYHGGVRPPSEQLALDALSVSLSRIILGPLDHGTPRDELAALLGPAEPLAEVIAFPGQYDHAEPRALAARPAMVYQLKVTLLDTKPPIWRRVPVDGASTLDDLHEVIQAAFGWFGTTTCTTSRSAAPATGSLTPNGTGARRPTRRAPNPPRRNRREGLLVRLHLRLRRQLAAQGRGREGAGPERRPRRPGVHRRTTSWPT